MTDRGKEIGSKADGLVVLRAGPLARELRVNDPFAAWFVTEEGRKLAQMAKSVDRVYEEFNLSRFRYTSELLTQQAGRFDQMVFLGAGFDCRSQWLTGLKEGRARIYEVDTPAKLNQKQEMLGAHGITMPDWIRSIPCDLRDPGVNRLLRDAGMDSQKPALLLAEGLFFYLPADVITRILNPGWLPLAKGSLVVFDCWSEARVSGLNRKVSEKIGIELFQSFPFMTEPEVLRDEIRRLGYAEVRVTALETLAKQYLPDVSEDEFPGSWRIVEATV